METCGLICVSGDYEKFLMRCSQCPTDVEVAQWQEFVLHIRNVHSQVRIIKDELKKIVEEDDEVLEDEVESKEEKTQAKEAETAEEANIELEIEQVGSSVYATEESNHSDTSDHEDYDQEVEPCELTVDEGEVKSAPTYKFNPSFFRRDPRTLKFIEIYKAHPCLWNPAHNHYKEPRAWKDALKRMLADLEATVAVFLNETTLKVAIKKVHMQFNTVHKRVLSGRQKSQSLAFGVYSLCSFLKASRDEEEANKNEKIKLDFSKKNKLTTDLIEMYANFPQLYDSTHTEFSNMNSRKQAYESLAAEISVPNVDINSDDIFRAIHNLRQWYYKSTKHAINAGSGAEKFYLEVCRFMPPKMFKQRLVCEICHQVTSSDHVLQSHIFKAHNIGELPFKCTLCDRSFVGRGELANHIQRVHIGKTHKCTHCERTFAVNSDLQLHIRTHTGHKPYVCEHCGKAFRLRSQMKLHVTAIHTKIRAFKCSMCPKDFLKKVDLSDHIKGHLNIRDKICSVCGKGFTSCHALIRHRQIHSEVKKFVCKLCDSRFSQFVGLNTHMKRTHNIVRNSSQKTKEVVDVEH
ncbi:myoneurin [Drosophila gunungcola]|uniref:myoneurin n=1 Tax=Drosophila gunungcola TaxID=103775 RepID=UPI0022E51A14|nr:myoneurin [Drosophila gunungcola]